MTMKRMGEAATDEERALEAAIPGVEHWLQDGVRYTAVGGGITNSNWRVSVQGRDYFVKIPGRGTEMFIDRAVALDASQKAHRLGVGPPIHDWLAAAGIEIADFIADRRPCGLADFADVTLRHSVIEQYRRLHTAPLLALTKTVFDMIDEHVAQVVQLNGWRPPDLTWLQGRVRDAHQAITGSGLDLVASFNDPMPGNFLKAADGSVLLIDYEFASNNDRAYDLGAWFGEMFFTSEQEADAIVRYAGRLDPALLARARIYKALADIKWATWSMVQEHISAVDFDYRKYGVWKYMRAREVMEDPRWPDWLAAV